MKKMINRAKSKFLKNFSGTVRRSIPKKSSQEYFKELSNLIKHFDVNSLKMESEYIWPYIRNRLWIQLYALGNGNMHKNYLPHTAIQRGSSYDLSYRQRKQLKRTYDVKEIEELSASDHDIDFLFITVLNAAEQVVLDDGRIYHRITDPFYEIAQTVGNAEKVEFLRVKTNAVKSSKNYYHKVLHIFPPLLYKLGFINKIKFGTLLSQLKKRIPSLVHSGENLRQSVDWELHTRDYYIEALKRLNPKIIFLNGFHFQTPLISAADHLNIITVDIQHGIQVGWNPLYNDWKEMPKEGYQGLPDYFFVWGDKEFSSIKKVFKGKKHSPIKVGFPWIERQVELTEKLKEKYIIKISKYKVATLLILQKQAVVPKIYKELIENSPNDHLWIVRHHPKGNKFKVKDFTKKDKDNILIDEYIDTITLSQLFPHIDVVVSEGSSVAAEADHVGLYNFIFSKKGRGNYTHEIKNGSFFFIRNYKEFFSTLNKLDINEKKSRANLYAKVDIESVLIKLLDEAKGKKNEQ